MRKNLFKLVKIAWLIIALYSLYYLLVQDTSLHLSISEILNFAKNCTENEHIFLIGLIPIYLGLIIFGAALLLFYLRSTLWPILFHSIRHWFHIRQKS